MTHQGLCEMTVQQLKALCRSRNLSGYSRLRKAELIEFLEQRLGEQPSNASSQTAAGSEEPTAPENPDVAAENLAAGESKTPDVEAAQLVKPTTPGVGKAVTLPSDLQFSRARPILPLIICDRLSALLAKSAQRSASAIAVDSPSPNLPAGGQVLDGLNSKLANPTAAVHFGPNLLGTLLESPCYQSCIESLFNSDSSLMAGGLKQNLPKFKSWFNFNRSRGSPKACQISVSRERSPPVEGV